MTAEKLRDLSWAEKREFVVLTASEYEAISHIPRLPERHIKHLRKAKRLKKDIKLLLTDGETKFALALLKENELVLESTFYLPKLNKIVSLYQAIIHPRALELLVAKGVELGVDEFNFFYSEYSQNYKVNFRRLSLIIENAQIQSWNFYRPKVNFYTHNLFSLPFPQNTTIYYGNWEKKTKAQKHIGHAAFINGPEGGFSAKEKEYLAKNFYPLWLSQNILRSETAAICAIYELKALTD